MDAPPGPPYTISDQILIQNLRIPGKAIILAELLAFYDVSSEERSVVIRAGLTGRGGTTQHRGPAGQPIQC